MWRTLQWVGASLLLISAGCGEKQASLYPVTGKLLVGGKAIPRIILEFQPVNAAAGTKSSDALTDAEGQFTVSTFKNNDGAPAGDYVVTLQMPPPAVRWGKVAKKTAPDPIPAEYKDPKTSPLKYTVKAGPNELGTIEIPAMPATESAKDGA